MESGSSTTHLDRDGEDRFQWLRRELGVTTFGLSLMRLEPGQRGRIHTHARQEEVYLVLEGTLTLGLDGEETDHGPDTVVRVAPDVRRQLTNRGPGRCLLIALGGAEPHDGRDASAYRTWDDPAPGSPREVPVPADLGPDELRRA